MSKTIWNIAAALLLIGVFFSPFDCAMQRKIKPAYPVWTELR